jgi:SAM-dependent methyltransferase
MESTATIHATSTASHASETVWQANIDEELGFWQEIVTGRFPEKAWCETSRSYLTQDMPIDHPYFYKIADYLDMFSETQINVANVGSGPCVPLRVTHPTHKIHMLHIDPLWPYYERILEAAGYRARTFTAPFPAETMDQALPHNHFHITWSRNALDHSWDPLKGIKNMIKITRPQGKIIVLVNANEGVRESYHGLHKWNFQPTPDGECELWNPDCLFNIGQELKDEVRNFTASMIPDTPMMFMTMTKC